MAGVRRCERVVARAPTGASLPEHLVVDWLRLGAIGLAAVLVLGVAVLAHETRSLEERLSRDEARVDVLAGVLDEHARRALTRDAFGAVRGRLESALSRTVRRVAALEARSEAGARVIAAVSRSVVFLQGEYGFVEAETGRPLRHVTSPDGRPRQTPQGPAVTLEGTGPVFVERFTGTAFVATSDRLLLTNRHVALPWETNATVDLLAQRGLVPVMHRFVGYVPGSGRALDVTLLHASEDADVAVLRIPGIPGHIPYLELAARPPRAGDEVIVLGYPTGMRALLARLGENDVDALALGDDADFWRVARQLAAGGHISPLATRGIVGQVSGSALVYDAETARGGSGGPVLDLDGRVLAINAAILPEFDGSNLGVPVDAARSLLVCAPRPPARSRRIPSVVHGHARRTRAASGRHRECHGSREDSR